MNFVPLVVPFFILAIVIELFYGLARRRNTYRLNDSVGSLMLGVLSQLRRFVVLGVGVLVYDAIAGHLIPWQLDGSHWATWVFALIFYDFCYYWLHRMGHERLILWAAHVAHHQSEEYNLTTALRQTSTGFLLSWIFYLPLFLCGVPADVVIAVGSINLIYQFWVHTRHVPKLGWYEWVFVTPSNHRVHHAQNDVYIDKNYGGIFILWDRLFGTFQEERDDEPCVYGIRGPLRSFSPLKALSHIYVAMCRDSWYTERWRDKLRVWFARTGWRPADVTRQFPDHKHDLSTFEKYDPAISLYASIYALLQLLAMVVFGRVLEASALSYPQGCFLALMVLWCATTTGWWLDGQPRAWQRDMWRLACLGVGLALFHVLAPLPAALHAVMVGYAVINILLLMALRSGLVSEPRTMSEQV